MPQRCCHVESVTLYLQSLLGDIGEASRTLHQYHRVWKQFGFTPEFYQIAHGQPFGGREGYPLRPGKLIRFILYVIVG